MSAAYYLEWDPFAADWLRELIKDGLIAPGVVDQRSIVDVEAADLKGFTQIHLFAGLGGWSVAARLAGWPDSRPFWSASCPCFPSGTLIFTKRGQVRIEEVVVGDLVLTHRGRWRAVLQTGSQEADSVTVKGQGHYGLQCTPDHPFLTGPEKWTQAQDLQGRRWATVAHVPAMSSPPIIFGQGYFFDKHAKKIRAAGEKGGKRVYLGLFDTSEQAESARREAAQSGRIDVRGANAVDITSLGFARFLGYWLGDGWISGDSILLCGAQSDAELLQEIMAGASLACSPSMERTSARVRCGSKILSKWMTDNFGAGAEGKKIPAWLHGMPEDYRTSFLEGYGEADGHTETQSCGEGSLRCFTTISKNIAIGVRMLLNQSGISASITRQVRNRECAIEGRSVNEKPTYRVTSYESARSFQFDGKLHGWGLVRSVQPSGRCRVFNVAVEEDESYVADGIIVHNCPPFSTASKVKACSQCGGLKPVPHVSRTGFFLCSLCGHSWLADQRHLWPEVWRLIRDARPACVVGEQVASADGRTWLDLVRASLEILAYDAWGVDTCAAGFGSPHIRQRLYWIADTDDMHGGSGNGEAQEGAGPHERGRGQPAGSGTHDRLGDTERSRLEVYAGHGNNGDQPGRDRAPATGPTATPGPSDGLDHAISDGRSARRENNGWHVRQHPGSTEQGNVDRMANAHRAGSSSIARDDGEMRGVPNEERGSENSSDLSGRGGGISGPGPVNGLWRDVDWLGCTDGKWRPVESSPLALADAGAIWDILASGGREGDAFTFPLCEAGTYRNRVAILKGAGNAVNIAQAAGFLRAIGPECR